MDLVSIIVPVYNVERYLYKCLDSLINQTYEDIEILLIDDGSTDGSGKICENYKSIDPRIKVFHKRNGGLSDARNYGIRFATGAHLMFVDSDDYIDREMVKELVFLQNKNNTLISGCSLQYEYENKSLKDQYNFSNLEVVLNSEKFFLLMIDYNKRLRMGVWNKIYSKILFQNVEFPYGRLYEDVGTMYKLIFSTDRISYIDKPLYHYLKRAGAITARKYDKKEIDRYIMTSSMVNYIAKNRPHLLDAAIIYKCINCDLSIINSMAISNVYDKRMIKLLKIDVKNNIKLLILSSIHILKKIQLLMFLLNFTIYKIVFKHLK